MARGPDIAVKRAYLPAAGEDGTRILVDRLWPRGLSREKLAAVWLKDVAPSTELRKWLHADPSRWDEFVARYREELDANPDAVEALRAHVKSGRVTLLYSVRDDAHNHAAVLRDYLMSKRGEKR
jgi:uncharacterized protein YeaO (DUF488 family)